MRTHTPAVSVVMPVHNGARFLGEAIDSIRTQSWDDFEFLIVDDGSTDDTPVLLAEAAAADRRISVVTHATNGGAAAARNSGLQRARADLVAVMDSDDVSLPSRLEQQVAFLRAHPEIGAVGAAVQTIDEHGVLGAIKAYPTTPALASWSMLFFNSMAHSTVMLRRAVVGDGYPRGAAEDYGLLAALSLRAPLANLPDVLLRYRTWPGSTTARAYERQEGHATEVVQHTVGRLLGRTIDRDTASCLRGLSSDRFPTRLPLIREAADIVERSAIVYAIHAPSSQDARAILRAAGTRLWLLAVLAAWRSPRAAAALISAAMALSRRSGADFAVKALRQIPRHLRNRSQR